MGLRPNNLVPDGYNNNCNNSYWALFQVLCMQYHLIIMKVPGVGLVYGPVFIEMESGLALTERHIHTSPVHKTSSHKHLRLS